MPEITQFTVEDERIKKRSELFQLQLFISLTLLIGWIMSIVALKTNSESQEKDRKVWVISLLGFIVLCLRFCYLIIKMVCACCFQTQTIAMTIGISCGMHLGLTRGIINCKTQRMFFTEDDRNKYIESMKQLDLSNLWNSFFFFVFLLFELIFFIVAIVVLRNSNYYEDVAKKKQSSDFALYIMCIVFVALPLIVLLLRTFHSLTDRNQSQEIIYILSPGIFSSQPINQQQANNSIQQINSINLKSIMNINMDISLAALPVITRISNVFFVGFNAFQTVSGVRIGVIPIVSFTICIIFGVFYIWFQKCVQFNAITKNQRMIFTVLLPINAIPLFMIFKNGAKYKKDIELEQDYNGFYFWYSIVLIFIDDLLEIVYQCLFMGLNQKVLFSNILVFIIVAINLVPTIYKIIRVFCYGDSITQQIQVSRGIQNASQSNIIYVGRSQQRIAA